MSVVYLLECGSIASERMVHVVSMGVSMVICGAVYRVGARESATLLGQGHKATWRPAHLLGLVFVAYL